MSGLRLRAIVVGGLALAAAAGSAGPALAARPSITFTSPGSGQQVPDSNPTVAARVEMSNGVLVDTIRLRVEQFDSSRPDITASRPAGASPQNVSFPLNLPYNGRYKATITATGSDRPLDLNGEESTTDSREFFVAAPPAIPTDVKTAVDATSRAVTVTWKANGEPDLLFYLVQRAKGSSTDFSVVGKVTAPEATFVDATTAEAGGDYRYQVVAVRNGTKEGEGVSSDPSALSPESTATVPDPPPPPTTATTAAGGAGVPAGSAGATSGSTLPAGSPGALTMSGKVDLSGFTTVQSQTRRAPTRAAPEVDTGFQSTLPFAAQPDDLEEGAGEVEEGGELGEVAADSPQFRELGDTEEGTDRQRTMAFFAAGLLATVLLMHVLWVKSEVKRVPLEAIAPEGPRPVAMGHEATRTRVSPEGVTAAKGRQARVKRTADLPQWFIPDRLGMDDSSGRVAPERAGRQRVSSGS